MSTEYPKESQVVHSKSIGLGSPQPYPYTSYPAMQYKQTNEGQIYKDQINERANDRKQQILKTFSYFSFKS